MELELTHPYEAGLERVLGAFFDNDLIQEKNVRVGNRNVKIAELTRDDLSAKLVVEREVASHHELPGILASFNREWHQVRQEEHWFRKDDGEWHCEFRVHVSGVPAKIKGNMKLQGSAGECTNYVTLNVRCDVPLLGKTIARFLLEDSRAKIEQEYQATRELL